ncbi:MAG: peptidase prolyl oligopeptidase active site domain protein [Candidatus Solibacter sp.]|nr:peptidase prolyl oligopeptidase active site domain protein [Candidatus Solibacter sp.]
MKIRITAAFLFTAALFAQPKPAITPADYGKWETMGQTVLSPDGKWLAAPIKRTNGTFELRIHPTAGGKTFIAASGTEPAFASNSNWAAYAIGYTESEEDKLKKAKKPVQLKLGIMDLSTGTAVTIDDVASFAFSDQDGYLAFRRYPAVKTPPVENADPAGAPLTVRDLKTGVDTTFGNVTSFAWQDKGTHLAMTIGVEGREGNAVQLFDPTRSELKVLDSGNAVFSALAWRKDSADLAALRSVKNKDYEGESNVGLAWKNLGAKTAGEVAAPKRVVASRTPQWSEDGATVYLGVADWDRKIDAAKSDDEPSNVEVWHPRDTDVISAQKLRLARDRDRHVVAAWHVGENRIVPLGTNLKETIQLPRTGSRAIAIDDVPYESTGMFGRRFVDVYKIDMKTGTRAKVASKLSPPVYPSPGGRYVLNFKDGEFWIYDLESGESRNVSKLAGVSFIDKEDDHPNPVRPSWGMAGWTKNDASVIVNGEFDLWELFPDGAKPKRLTDGASEQVRHRYVNPEAPSLGGRGGRGGGAAQEPIDLAKPVYVSVNGIWTKKNGYGLLSAGKVDRTVWLDRNTSRLSKAKQADVFTYDAEDFNAAPNVFVAGKDLRDAKQATDTNPFAKDYAWGKSQLIEYKSPKGERLQGALFYPANYDPAKKYPLIVHIYERESQFLHRYFPVSDRSPYTEAIWTANGYFVLMPDIVFRPRDPGMSVLECVTTATKKVLESGMIDPKRVGLIGHSWGGFGTSFVMTQTDLFTAGVAGGPLTDLVSSYGEIYWNSGTPETDHAEVGQERLEVPLWEDPAAYMRNSAVFHVNKMKGALLLSVGDKDGASDWHQDIEMYNLARRAGKQCIMLVYPGENHALAVKANQQDYHRRILEWFDHYLKDQAPKPWIDKGVTVLDREKELKRTKKDATPQ